MIFLPTYHLPTGVFGHTNKQRLVLPLRLLMREGGRKGGRKAGKQSKAKQSQSQSKAATSQNRTGGASERAKTQAGMAEEDLQHHKPSSANGDGVAAADAASCGSVVAGYSQPVLQSYSLKDVKKHDTPEDCWLIIWGKVYDVTSWYVCISLSLCVPVCVWWLLVVSFLFFLLVFVDRYLLQVLSSFVC